MGIFKATGPPRYMYINIAQCDFASCRHVTVARMRRLITLSYSVFVWKRRWKQAQKMRESDGGDGLLPRVSQFAYRLAFVHEELHSVFRMRRRMQQYGRPELPQHTFRVRPPSLTKEKLEQIMAEMNNGSYSVGEAPWIQNCNGLPDARTSI